MQVLTTISANSNNKHPSTLNQSSSSLPSNSLTENSHNIKQLASQKQQHPPIALTCFSQVQEIWHSIQTNLQRSARNIAMKNMCG